MALSQRVANIVHLNQDQELSMQKLCDLDAIQEDQSKGFEIDGVSLFAVRKDGQVHVYQNQCPHLSIPLEFMPDQFLDSENYFIQCSTHGALFEVESGNCVSGPCVGDKLTPIECSVDNNQILVRLPESVTA